MPPQPPDHEGTASGDLTGASLARQLHLPATTHLALRRYQPSLQTLATLLDGDPLPPEMARAVLKRQVEFLAGRLCARTALAAAGFSGGRAELSIGPHRAPQWPPGYLGSITHCDGMAMAVAARADTGLRAIGLDMEHPITPEVARNIGAQIATTSEIALGPAAGYSDADWLTLIFSAKESLFKALYPSVGRYFDFADAQVETVDITANTITVRLVTDLSPHCRAGMRYPVRYTWIEQRALTCLAVQ